MLERLFKSNLIRRGEGSSVHLSIISVLDGRFERSFTATGLPTTLTDRQTEKRVLHSVENGGRKKVGGHGDRFGSPWAVLGRGGGGHPGGRRKSGRYVGGVGR